VRHIEDLLDLRRQGARVVLLFAVLHEGIDVVRPAAEIDPVYAQTLKLAAQHGLEVLAYKAVINDAEIFLADRLSVIL
jgi:sugar fermentation stimulation protein A